MTYAVKDEHHDAGWNVTQVSVINKDDRRDTADDIVTKLKAASVLLPIQTKVWLNISNDKCSLMLNKP